MIKAKNVAILADTKSVQESEYQTPNTFISTAEKWNKLYVSICKGISLKESLAACGWTIEMEPHAKKNWKDALTARSAIIKERIAKGEPPYPAGSKQSELYEMLKTGCTSDDLQKKFEWKTGQVANRARQVALLVAGDLVKTERKGVTSLKLESE